MLGLLVYWVRNILFAVPVCHTQGVFHSGLFHVLEKSISICSDSKCKSASHVFIWLATGNCWITCFKMVAPSSTDIPRLPAVWALPILSGIMKSITPVRMGSRNCRLSNSWWEPSYCGFYLQERYFRLREQVWHWETEPCFKTDDALQPK